MLYILIVLSPAMVVILDWLPSSPNQSCQCPVSSLDQTHSNYPCCGGRGLNGLWWPISTALKPCPEPLIDTNPWARPKRERRLGWSLLETTLYYQLTRQSHHVLRGLRGQGDCLQARYPLQRGEGGAV